MQYLKEHPNGVREQVTELQFSVDRLSKYYQQILAHPLLVVYRMKNEKIGKPEPRYHYGGRKRGGVHLPWNGC